ncbi:MAG: hypothetical protein Q9160_000235 [Pyrenula sp. 1 TL-2023]
MSSPNLSTLPSELRLQIYAFIFPPNTDFHISRSRGLPTNAKSLLQLSRFFRHESLPSLYSPTRTFHLRSQHDLVDWTRSLDRQAKHLTTSIVVAVSTPPRVGRICEWIRQVDLSLRDMTGLKELRLRISLLWHQDATRLGTELVKLVRPLFAPTQVRLIVETVRCAQCDASRDEELWDQGLWDQGTEDDEDDEVQNDTDNDAQEDTGFDAMSSASNVAYAHHLWTWDFLPGSRRPLVHRRISKDERDGKRIRPLVMDNLLACAKVLEQAQSPQQTQDILSNFKRSTVIPALSEPVRCKDCARRFLYPTTLQHLMQLLCEECGIDLMAFCSTSCDIGHYVGSTDGLWVGHGRLESREWHKSSCVRRGWTKTEKEGIRTVVKMMEGFEEDEEHRGLYGEDNEVDGSAYSGVDGDASGLEARLSRI